MAGRVRWVFGTILAMAIIGVPAVFYRIGYSTEKRFREVTPGKFYRCGQMSADAFRKQIREHGIKTVINLQDEFPDPVLSSGYWDSPHIPESQVCAEAGARYMFLTWAGERGLLARTEASPTHRPQVIDDFLQVCDDASNYPILIHCMAGLHRTGALTAVYRMEYEGWPVADAVRELRANGYGDRKATTANDYIYEYLYLYQPRANGPRAQAKGQ
jgi:tyrosine-protein phosphatase SIW14